MTHTKKVETNLCIIIFSILIFGLFEPKVTLGMQSQGYQGNTPQCGHWAIQRSCELLGAPMHIGEIMRLLPSSEQGHSMYDFVKVLKKIGISCEGRELALSNLSTYVPCIAHMKPDHFVVVVEVVDEDYVALFDGEGRRSLWPITQFSEHWTGKILHIRRKSQKGALPTYLRRKSTSGSCIQFDALLVDKGELCATGEIVDFVFPFSNLGDSDLVIYEVKRDCLCLESVQPTKPVPPGGQDQIILKYRITTKDSGSFNHSALVRTNDPVLPVIKLTTCGTTARSVTIEPSYLDLGEIIVCQKALRICYVKFTGDIPLKITRIECPSDRIKVAWKLLSQDNILQYCPALGGKVKTVGSNKKYLQIEIIPEQNAFGMITTELFVHTNIEDYKKLRVPIVAEVKHPIELSPSILYLRRIKHGVTIDKTIRAWSPDGVPFRIARVDTGDTGLQSTYSQDENGKTHIAFHGKIDDPSKITDREINILVELLDSKKSLSIKLPLYASIITN
ncbi:MAG: cysteine peptidase family C39 domain-containing protein [Phycisphaerae bacterium]|nr:cysteine peptidase family C39 domain-containing protein [Phycisphaerae bacterium]